MPIFLPFKHYEIPIRHGKEGQEFWDIIRRKWLLLTPEEWVRQNIVHHLIVDLKYPKGSISIEKEIKYGALSKRYDMVVYDPFLQPWMLIECKASNIAIDESVLNQLLNYQQVLKTPYWMLSNGHHTYLWGLEGNHYIRKHETPHYP